MFLLIIPSTWFAFIAATEHCADDFPFWWIITPKSLSCSTDFSSFPPISSLPRWFLLPICSTIHLSTLNNICQSSDHRNSFLKSPLIVSASASLHTLLQILLSSANFQIFDMMPSSISFINIKNSNGPNTKPCGTPLFTSAQPDTFPFILTLCLLSANQFLIHLKYCPPMPCASNFVNKQACGTLSNALAKSRYITSTGTPSFKNLVTVSRYSSRFFRQDLPFLKPCCVAFIRLKVFSYRLYQYNLIISLQSSSFCTRDHQRRVWPVSSKFHTLHGACWEFICTSKRSDQQSTETR